MALININSEGNRPVGPLGLKKAEHELIKRRYKQHHYNVSSDHHQSHHAHHLPPTNLGRVSHIYAQGRAQANH